MGFFDRFRKKNEPKVGEKNTTKDQYIVPIKDEPKVSFTRDISSEETELATVIASAVAAGSMPDSKFRVKSVTGIDTDKEIAAAIVSAVAAGDHPDSHFRIVSITEVK